MTDKSFEEFVQKILGGMEQPAPKKPETLEEVLNDLLGDMFGPPSEPPARPLAMMSKDGSILRLEGIDYISPLNDGTNAVSYQIWISGHSQPLVRTCPKSDDPKWKTRERDELIAGWHRYLTHGD